LKIIKNHQKMTYENTLKYHSRIKDKYLLVEDCKTAKKGRIFDFRG